MAAIIEKPAIRIVRRIEAAPEKAALSLLHEQFAETEARDRHEQGWNGCLARLARLLA